MGVLKFGFSSNFKLPFRVWCSGLRWKLGSSTLNIVGYNCPNGPNIVRENRVSMASGTQQLNLGIQGLFLV